MHGLFLRKIQFGQQTFWGKQGIKSTIHKLLLNLLQKEILISGLTGWSGEENSDANYIFSLRLKYTLLDHWPKHVNIRTFFVFRGPQNAGKSRNQFHVDIVQSLTVRWRSKSVNTTFSTKSVIPKCYCLLQFILSTFILHCCLHFILSTSRFVS